MDLCTIFTNKDNTFSLFTPNAIIYVDQSCNPGLSCSVNSFYAKESDIQLKKSDNQRNPNPLYNKKSITDYSILTLDLEDCVSSFLSPDMLLIILKTGEAYSLELSGSEQVGGFNRRKGGVTHFKLENLEFTLPICNGSTRIGLGYLPHSTKPISKCLGSLSSKPATDSEYVQMGYIFLSSLYSECTLLQFYENEKQLEKQLDMDDIIMDEDDIYGTSTIPTATINTKSSIIKPHFQFRVCDSLPTIGPIKDMSISKSNNYSTFAFEGNSSEIELVSCAGTGNQG